MTAPHLQWVDPWPGFIAQAAQIESLCVLLAKHLIQRRDMIDVTGDDYGWDLSRELDASDCALEKLGVHPGGGRQ